MILLYAFGDSATSTLWPAAVLDASLKSIIVFAAAGVLSLALRRASAGLRHLIWFLAIVSLILLPVLSVVLPHWTGLLIETPVVVQSHSPYHVPTDKQSPQPLTSPVSRWTPQQFQPSPAVATPASSTNAIVPLPMAAFFSIIWLAGMLIVLIPLLTGMLCVWRRARRSQRITDGPLVTVVSHLANELGLRRHVTLLRDKSENAATMPMTWGVRRPVLLLPADAENWSTDRIRVVLLHELSHVQRWDWLTQMLAHVTRAIYWFNPLIWLAVRRMRIESECACDNRVLLNSGGKATDYAEHLLGIARTLRSPTCTSLATIAMARPSFLQRRLEQILAADQSQRPVGPLAVVLGVVLVVCVVFPLGAIRLTQASQAPQPPALIVQPASLQSEHTNTQPAKTEVVNRWLNWNRSYGQIPNYQSFFAAQTQTKREQVGLLGRVETVTIEEAKVSQRFGEPREGLRRHVSSHIYDNKGNLIEKTRYESDGGIDKRWVFDYNTRGDMIKKTRYDDNGSLKEKWVYAYDARGKMTEKTQYESDGSIDEKWVYTYNDKGHMTEDTHYTGKGSLCKKWVYAYDEGGSVIEASKYDKNGSLKDKWVYAHDNKGNVTEKIQYDDYGRFDEKTIYAYDKEENLIERTEYDNDNDGDKWIYVHDDKGNVTDKTMYDKNGSLKDKRVYAYEFDAAGNWIKKNISKRVDRFGESDLEPSLVICRAITYY